MHAWIQWNSGHFIECSRTLLRNLIVDIYDFNYLRASCFPFEFQRSPNPLHLPLPPLHLPSPSLFSTSPPPPPSPPPLPLPPLHLPSPSPPLHLPSPSPPLHLPSLSPPLHLPSPSPSLHPYYPLRLRQPMNCTLYLRSVGFVLFQVEWERIGK